jgi:proteasome accessory factor B
MEGMSMQRSKVQFARLIQVDQQIRKAEYPNCFSLAEDLEVSVKTAQRDLDYMRDRLNAPIEYDPLKKGYFYTSGNWFLPALSLSEGDLLAVLLASRVLEQYHGTPVAKQLEAIFKKIVESLPEKITLQPELVFSRFSFSGPPAKPVDHDIWTVIVRGLLHQRSVQMKYRAMETDEATERQIDPYHIANLQGEWHVFAHDHSAEELRQFAIPRMQTAKLTENRFEVPADFDPDQFLSVTFGRFAISWEKPHEVKLLFEREVTPWVIERQWSPQQSIKKRANGQVELSFRAAGLYEVSRWVLAWGHSVRVQAPKELKDMVHDEIKAMATRLRKK